MTEATNVTCADLVGCFSGVIFHVVDAAGQALHEYVLKVSSDEAAPQTFRCPEDGICTYGFVVVEGFPGHVSGSVQVGEVEVTFDSDVEYSASMRSGPYCRACVAANVLVTFKEASVR